MRCLEDPQLVDQLVEQGVMLEVCPTSNDLLQVVSSLDEHPLPRLRAAGLRLCLNTDDPGWFATDLNNELAIATEHLGVSPADHVVMQDDAVDASFAAAEVKSRLQAEIAAVLLPDDSLPDDLPAD